MREKTFPLNSTIKHAVRDFRLQIPVLNSSLWRSQMATVHFGLCHTFLYPGKLEAGQAKFGFYLEPSLNLKVMLHDPQFYHVLANSLSVPRLWLQYQAGQNMPAGHFEWRNIILTQYHLLNRPEQPCEEGEDYDFLQCVKTSQARRVGCRPPWDIWSPHTLPLCQTVEELEEHERLDQITSQSEQETILRTSGCLAPCRYQEYKTAGEPRTGPTPPLEGDQEYRLRSVGQSGLSVIRALSAATSCSGSALRPARSGPSERSGPTPPYLSSLTWGDRLVCLSESLSCHYGTASTT